MTSDPSRLLRRKPGLVSRLFSRLLKLPFHYIATAIIILIVAAPDLISKKKFSDQAAAFSETPFSPGQILAYDVNFAYRDALTSVAVSAPRLAIRNELGVVFAAGVDRWLKDQLLSTLPDSQIVRFKLGDGESSLQGRSRSVALDRRILGVFDSPVRFAETLPTARTGNPAPKRSRAPVQVEAESGVVLSQNRRVLSSEGPTRIVWGDYRLQLPNLEIRYDMDIPANIESVSASGALVFNWPGGRIDATALSYDGGSGIATLAVDPGRNVRARFGKATATLGQTVAYELDRNVINGKGPLMFRDADIAITAPTFDVQLDCTGPEDSWTADVRLLDGVNLAGDDIAVTGNKLIYSVNERVAEVCGNVTVTSQNTVISGDCLTYDGNSQDFRLTGAPARGWFTEDAPAFFDR